MKKSYSELRSEVLDLLGGTQVEQAEALGLVQGKVSQMRKPSAPDPRSTMERLLLLAFDELGPRQQRKAILAAAARLRQAEGG